MSETTIEWTNRTWNPVRGCTRISHGCKLCYAEGIAARFSNEGQPFHMYADRERSGSKWTGMVDLIEDKLLEPLSWRKPTTVFVNSMSDLFHERLMLHDIAEVFRVMRDAHWHTFQVLTKRAERLPRVMEFVHQHLGLTAPLPNVWLGVSVEDQQRADERIPHLRATPAAVRFISQEPQLESITHKSLAGIDWVIIGGESGPGARPFDIEWPRRTIRQCRAAGVKVFVKQLGARPGTLVRTGDGIDDLGMFRFDDIKLKSKKGGDPAEWPEDVRVREMPEVRR